MASRRRSGFSSPFDEMVEKTRKQFDDLSGGMAPRWPGNSGPPRRTAPREVERYAPRTAEAPPPSPEQKTAPQLPGPAAGFDAGSMDPARFLDDRFGGGWRHEITDRRRDGDDVVVQCRLGIDGEVHSRTQMGRARIYAAGPASEIAGSAAANLTWLLATQSSGRIGSPRVAGSTSRRKSPSNVGSWVVSGRRPLPSRRIRPGAKLGPSRSFSPRPIVLRARPVARDTAATPPRAAARASVAAKSRRPRSSS